MLGSKGIILRPIQGWEGEEKKQRRQSSMKNERITIIWTDMQTQTVEIYVSPVTSFCFSTPTKKSKSLQI